MNADVYAEFWEIWHWLNVANLRSFPKVEANSQIPMAIQFSESSPCSRSAAISRIFRHLQYLFCAEKYLKKLSACFFCLWSSNLVIRISFLRWISGYMGFKTRPYLLLYIVHTNWIMVTSNYQLVNTLGFSPFIAHTINLHQLTIARPKLWMVVYGIQYSTRKLDDLISIFFIILIKCTCFFPKERTRFLVLYLDLSIQETVQIKSKCKYDNILSSELK